MRRGLILVVAWLTASLAVAQVQVQDQRAWGQRPINPRDRSNTLAPLVDGSAVSATSLAAPKKARAAFDKAIKEIAKGSSAHLDIARQHLEKSVAEYPEYAAAWTKLGQVKADIGDPVGAIVALEKSIELDERYLAPYAALVWLYMDKGDWDHATELTKFVLDINPADAKMRWYQAGCAYESGRDDEALALFGKIRNDAEAVKQFPETHLFLGLIYARHGRLGEAAAAYQRYLEFVPKAPDAEAVKKQINEWGQLGVI